MQHIKNRFVLSNEQGAVAMLSVTIFAIIITVVATSYIKTVISQQRSALDYDNGTRAYYAAEVGVQDGARAIQADASLRANGKSDCKPVGAGPDGQVALKSPNYGLAYTCQIINATPSDIRGSVIPGEKNAMIKIEPATPDASGKFQLVLRWSKQTESPEDTILHPRSDERPLFPSVGNWGASNFNTTTHPIHAMLRTQFISHPKTTSFGTGDIAQRVVFLNPTDVGIAGGSPVISSADLVAEQQKNLFVKSACYDSQDAIGRPGFDGFSCKRTIKFDGYNLENNAFYVNIGSVYRSTDFSIELLNDAGTVLPLANTQATIDVTGKAGDTTFRRVRQTLPLGGYAEQSGPNAALVVGEGICKHFAVGTVPGLYQPGCDPLATP